MRLVINIPDGYETKYRSINNGSIAARVILNCVANGTPIPKGCGRLIDAEEVKRRMGNLDGVGMIGRCIDEFPTIVEADTTESEG